MTPLKFGISLIFRIYASEVTAANAALCFLAATAKRETIHFMSHHVHRDQRTSFMQETHSSREGKRSCLFTPGLWGSWVRLLKRFCWWHHRCVREILQTSVARVLRWHCSSGHTADLVWAPSCTQVGALLGRVWSNSASLNKWHRSELPCSFYSCLDSLSGDTTGDVV